jgi:hypothetical protein
VSETATAPASPSEAAEAPKPKQKPTEYHILKLVDSSGATESYTVHARNIEAQGSQAAIRKAVTASDQAQTFVAIPSRSFQPITVTVETKTQMKLS